jgi:hypothetical protein
MKINTLLEYTSPSSQPNQAGGQAPKFGRDPNVLETTTGATATGSIGADATAMPGMQRRSGKGSMFQGISTSKKFVNSPVTEDEISEEQLLTKELRKELFKRAKDRDIGNRPKNHDIMSKESDPEYDDEAGMATTNLHTALRAVEGLNKVIGPNENLPEWVQEKIAIANDYLVTCWDYMISQQEQGRKYEVDENQDWMKDIAAMAHKMAPQDKMRERQAQRDAQAKAEQQQRLQQDVENLPDLISQYNDMEAEYESMGGSNWQYADREQNLSDKERKARGMETSMRHLANRIHAAKKASEGLEEAKPDFAKMFNKKIGKHNAAVVKTKKEIGTRVADIGPGGKEYNVKTDKEWDKQKGVTEVAPPGAKAERMVKHIKKSYSNDGKITPKEKSIAYATAWKTHNKGKVEEQGMAEDSSENKYSNLSLRGVNRGINRAAADVAQDTAPPVKESADANKIWSQYSQYSKEDLMQEFPQITPKDAQTIVNYSQYAWDFVKSGATKQPEFINAKNQVVQRVQQAMGGQQGVAEGGAKDRQWSNKDMERLRVATRDFDDIMASDGPEAFKQELIKKRIKTKPMVGPKGVLPEQGVAESDLEEIDRRGFLKGVGAAAVAGAASKADAEWVNRGTKKDDFDDSEYGGWDNKSTNGTATLMLGNQRHGGQKDWNSYLHIKSNTGRWRPFVPQGHQGPISGMWGRIRLDNSPVINVHLGFSEGNNWTMLLITPEGGSISDRNFIQSVANAQRVRIEVPARSGDKSDREVLEFKKEKNESVNQGVAEGMGGSVVFSGTGDNGGKYEIIQSGPNDFMIHANGKHIDSYDSLQRAMSVLKNEVPGLKKTVDEESKGLWANIHAKRDRIKQGSGEHMRNPGSKGAPTKDALRKSAK